jgi:hypothetical protein
MTERRIESVDGLFNALRSLWSDHYIFRGESSAGFVLRPKYGRYVSSTREGSGLVEQRMMERFAREAAPHLQVVPSSDWEWLAIAQHYGMATRLLDWTTNPLIATFFAVQRPEIPQDRVVYVLPQSAVPTVSLKEIESSPFGFSGTRLYRPKHLAARITSQRGLFTVHSKPNEVFVSPKLQRWVIDGSEPIIDIATTLETFGIDSAFVFPGMDGIAATINDDYLRGLIDEETKTDSGGQLEREQI